MHNSILGAAVALVIGASGAHANGDQDCFDKGALGYGGCSFEPYWFIEAGPLIAGFLNTDATIKAKNVPVVITDAADESEMDLTLAANIGYRFSPWLSAHAQFAVPPKAVLKGADGAKLGSIDYGLAIGGPQLHLPVNIFGLEPYVGAGGGALLIFNNHDKIVTDLDVETGALLYVNSGVHTQFEGNYYGFADIRYVWADTDITANVPGLGPADIEFESNVIAVHLGVGYRF